MITTLSAVFYSIGSISLYLKALIYFVLHFQIYISRFTFPDISLCTMASINDLYDIANKIRLYSLASTTKAGSGHPTSCFSIAEVMSVLFFHTLKQSKEFPKHPSSDRFILSKGHAAPVLYAAWTVAGLLTEEQNLSLRQVVHFIDFISVLKYIYVKSFILLVVNCLE